MPILQDPIKEFAKHVLQAQKNLENQQYGEFIIQTNEVQGFLALVIYLYSRLPDKGYSERLFEQLGLGQLITLFQACVPRTEKTYILLQDLKSYNKRRIRLAHKMWSSKKKLTTDECNIAITAGKRIQNSLNDLVKKKNKELGLG